jgi:TonB-linked SusC/RagA family outer membrane protein
MLLMAVLCSLAARSQDKIQVAGSVADSASAEPLPGVSIRVLGTNTGAQTDAQGRFSISVARNAILVFGFMGYQQRSYTVTRPGEITMRLPSTNENLNEVVVVGYGQQKKISVTGAVASVGSEELRTSTSASLAVSLAGKLPGLSSMQTGGGQPGRDDATMYLRGVATTNGASPLILIDGVPRDNIRTIDPNEVETVSILKDASATAVFGVRGANGVILITTKRGAPGKAELNLSVDQSYASFIEEPSRLHSVDYMRLRNEASKNDGIATPPFSEAVIDKYRDPLKGLDPNDPDYEKKAADRRFMYPDNDYYRMFIKRYAPQTRANLGIRGGTDRVSYFANANFLHQGGNLNTEPKSRLGYDPESRLNRWSFRGNLDYRITNALKALLNIGSYIERVNMPSAGLYGGGDTNWMMSDLIYQAQAILPITPGPTTPEGHGIPAGKIVDPGYMDRSAFEIINRYGFRHEVRSNLNTSVGLEWDLGKLVTPGLSMRGMVSYDSRSTTAMQGYKVEPLYVAQVNYDTDELVFATKRTGEQRLSLAKGADSRYNINMQGGINYNRLFNKKHNVGGMVLAQRDFWETTGGEIPFNVLGIAARATYGYDNRYMAEVNMGYNGSEQFAPKKRYGFFPAVSAGWAVSNEAFLKESNVITNLKFRASYGKVGNDKIGSARFLYQSDIVLEGGPLGSLGLGRKVNQRLLGNNDISWEVAKKQNYGVDLQLFKDLSITFDYFIEERSGILIGRGTIPNIQGVGLGAIPKVNMGVVDNKGFEIELNYQKRVNKDLFVQFRGNYGANHNMVRFVDEAIRDESYVHRLRATGWPLGQLWGYRVDRSNGNGFFNSQDELDKYMATTRYGFGSPRVGDLKYADLNGDGVVDDKDQAPLGNTHIPGFTYGATFSVTYKAFDLMVFFQGVGKFSGLYAEQGVYEYIYRGTYFDYHRTAWTPERYANGEKITYPALSTRRNTNHNSNDFFIVDRSFLRLRNVELSYNLPGSLLRRVGMKAARIYVSGQNMHTWSKTRMTHLDPEYNNAIGYPTTRTMTAGFTTTF